MRNVFTRFIATAASGAVLLLVFVLLGIGAVTACFGIAASLSPSASPERETPTPVAAAGAAGPNEPQTQTPARQPPTNTPQPAVAPSSMPVPPTPRPQVVPTQPAAPAAAAPAASANFSGVWRVIDTVTEGSGVGQTFSFDIQLSQTGSQLTGGNSGLVISGGVSGATAQVQYVQPALGYSGSFTWTMGPDGNAIGSFTNSLPNAGMSQLVRR